MSDELKGTTVSDGAGMSPAEAVEYWYQRWETAYDRCISLETSLDAARAEITRLSDSVAEGLTAPWLAFDIGCIECGESSGVIGLFATEEEADAACEAAATAQKVDWRGQHSFESFNLLALTQSPREETDA